MTKKKINSRYFYSIADGLEIFCKGFKYDTKLRYHYAIFGSDIDRQCRLSRSHFCLSHVHLALLHLSKASSDCSSKCRFFSVGKCNK